MQRQGNSKLNMNQNRAAFYFSKACFYAGFFGFVFKNETE